MFILTAHSAHYHEKSNYFRTRFMFVYAAIVTDHFHRQNQSHCRFVWKEHSAEMLRFIWAENMVMSLCYACTLFDFSDVYRLDPIS